MDAYRALVDEAERDNAGFWARLARETLAWRKPFTQVLDDTHAPFYRWFGDGRLNASFIAWTGTSPAGWASAPPLSSKPTTAR